MMASSGSPSAARVDGMNPQSCGYARPLGNGRDTIITPCSASYLNFDVDPRGDSTTTRNTLSPENAGSVSRPLGDAMAPIRACNRCAGGFSLIHLQPVAGNSWRADCMK